MPFVVMKVKEGKILVRTILNLFMVTFFLVIMNYRFIGNTPHEIGGVVLALCILFHNGLNWHWYKSFFKGKQNLHRLLSVIINWFLFLSIVILLITGLLISQTIASALTIRGGSALWIYDLHQGSAYASFILIGIHLGLHWNVLIIRCKQWFGVKKQQFVYKLIYHIISVYVIGYGIFASFENHIASHLLMEHIMSWNQMPSFWNFFLDYFGILGSYVGSTFYLMLLLQKNKI